MWFIISMVYMSTIAGIDPEIYVYKKIYNNKINCQAVYQNNPQPFINQMTEMRPHAIRLSFKCVDRKLLMEMKQLNRLKNL